jgi:hypothetical protein
MFAADYACSYQEKKNMFAPGRSELHTLNLEQCPVNVAAYQLPFANCNLRMHL